MSFQGFKFTELEVDSYDDIKSALTVDGKRKFSKMQYQYWIINATLEPTYAGKNYHSPNGSVPKLVTHRLFNLVETFTMDMPQHQGIAVDISELSANIHLTVATAKKDTTITVANIPAELDMSGVFFSIAGDLKIYMMGNRNGHVFDVFPPIRKVSGVNTNLDFTPRITVGYEPENLKAWGYKGRAMAGIKVSLEERLQ